MGGSPNSLLRVISYEQPTKLPIDSIDIKIRFRLKNFLQIITVGSRLLILKNELSFINCHKYAKFEIDTLKGYYNVLNYLQVKLLQM